MKKLTLLLVAVALTSCSTDPLDSKGTDCNCDRVTEIHQFNTTTGTYWNVKTVNDCGLYPSSYRNVYSKPNMGDCL